MKPQAAADVAASYTENDQRAFRVRQAIEAIEQACTPEGLRTYLSIKFSINDTDGNTTTIGSISIDITKRVLEQQRMARLGAHGDWCGGWAPETRGDPISRRA